MTSLGFSKKRGRTPKGVWSDSSEARYKRRMLSDKRKQNDSENKNLMRCEQFPMLPFMNSSLNHHLGALLLLTALLSAAPNASLASGIPEPGVTLYGKVLNKFNGATTRLTHGEIKWTFKPLAGGAWVTVTNRLTNINDQFSFVIQVPCESEIAGLSLSPNTLKVPTAPASVDRATVLVNTQAVTFVNAAQSIMALAANERGRVERVDLQVAIAPVDLDGDGLPDDWEMAHFGSLAAAANADPDGDGVSNQAEHQAGTDPNDPQSLFTLIHITPHQLGGIEVQWSSATEKSYIIQRSGNLLSGFTDVATGIAATPPINLYHDTTATGQGPFFYRLRLE
jgi:hypothetical protein